MQYLMLLLSMVFGHRQPMQNPFPYPYVDQSSCAPLAELYDAQVIPWIGYQNDVGWGLSPDLKMIDRVDFQDGGGDWVYRGGRDYTEVIAHFFDYEAGADSNGDHYGYHHVCMLTRAVHPLRWSLETTGTVLRDQYSRLALIYALHH